MLQRLGARHDVACRHNSWTAARFAEAFGFADLAVTLRDTGADEDALDPEAQYEHAIVSAYERRRGLGKVEELDYGLMLDVVEHIVTREPNGPGAILVFLPGHAEITTMQGGCERLAAAIGRQFMIVRLHSSCTIQEQQQAFTSPRKGVVKIVLSTNIAETSVTIDDVVYVIDSGRMKEKVCLSECLCECWCRC